MTKRKQISTEEKYNAILRLENEECTQQKIADELGINKATVSKWMEETQRLIIKKAFEEENVKSDRKRLRFSKYLELEITVYDWFKRTRAEHPEIGISGPIILKKAEHFAVLHGFTEFKPNSGWLDRWKKR